MRAQLTESCAADGRQGDTGYKKRLWRVWIEQHPFFRI
jgi:hypothetical protein